MKVCSVPGCPTLSTGSRCPTHARAHERKRGTRQQRGYDTDFDRQKRTQEYQRATHCASCGTAFTPKNPKTAGHIKAIRKGGMGGPIEPQCRTCNYGWRRTDT